MEAFLSAAVRGLREIPRAIPPKYLYDQNGSFLFEEICRQPEYYPTRTEIAILMANIEKISAEFPDGGTLIELGSGASVKTEILLDALIRDCRIRAYLPFDISKECLLTTAERLKKSYPALRVYPVCGDFTHGKGRAALLAQARVLGRMGLAFLPGSTLGNFDPPDAVEILASMHDIADRFIVGIDLEKDPDVLEAAYNDAAGVTARFNRNLLVRLAREGGIVVDPEDFIHEAFYRESMRRIEMHLVARKRVKFRLAGEEFRFSPGDSIHTESSYKYSITGFEALAAQAGFRVSCRWTDSNRWFGVFLLDKILT